MTQSIGLQSPENRPLPGPRRSAPRRTLKAAAERRPQFTRSDVRRGTGVVQDTDVAEDTGEKAARFQERLATLQVQASIVAAMLGMLVFFRGPLAAAFSSLFG